MTEKTRDSSSERPDGPPLEVGYVAGSHGVRGTVRVHLHDADSTALNAGRVIQLHRDGTPEGQFEIVSVTAVPGKANRKRVVLSGIDDRDAADALKGTTVKISRAELEPLADGEFYLVDAIGVPVQRERDGQVQALGKVTGITTNGAQDLFEVRWRAPSGAARQWLLPVIPQFVLDQGADRILVDVPLGFLPDELENDS
ncbi:MAG: ribosome maturation factor RimM [Myxococcota bacterium]